MNTLLKTAFLSSVKEKVSGRRTEDLEAGSTFYGDQAIPEPSRLRRLNQQLQSTLGARLPSKGTYRMESAAAGGIGGALVGGLSGAYIGSTGGLRGALQGGGLGLAAGAGVGLLGGAVKGGVNHMEDHNAQATARGIQSKVEKQDVLHRMKMVRDQEAIAAQRGHEMSVAQAPQTRIQYNR